MHHKVFGFLPFKKRILCKIPRPEERSFGIIEADMDDVHFTTQCACASDAAREGGKVGVIIRKVEAIHKE